MDKAVELTIAGKVVGVNFRGWAQLEAQRLGLAGWARNNTDQTVTIIVEGPAETVDQFVEAANRGPAGAEVTSVDVRDAEIRGLSGFTAEY